MTETTAASLAPVTGKARIEVLDILRGLAILGIFFMNIPFMAASISDVFVNVRAVGWTAGDQAAWWTVRVLLEGTQRGLLELLFGAGMMVLAARAMTPDGPVAVADLYWRRNLWLLAFGLVDIFVLGWAGDILHVYALAALFLFPFRKLGPRLLLALSLSFAAFVMVSGAFQYAERSDLMQRVTAAEQQHAAGAPLAAEQKAALAEWQKLIKQRKDGPPELLQMAKMERDGRTGGVFDYLAMNIGLYVSLVFPSLLFAVAEAFCVMLLGVALWKWGVIQGQRSARFYLLLMLACYVPGFALRAIEAQQFLLPLPVPKIGWMTQEIARIAVAVGHVALVNLAVKAATGRLLLAPFRAAGRTAFSLYFMQQIVGLWILFAPWGPGLWGERGWAAMMGVALAVIAAQVVIANLWLRWFANGPMEWAWRSLSYLRWQPFRRAREAVAPAEPAALPA